MIAILTIISLHLIPWIRQPHSKIALDPAKIIFLISAVTTIPYFSLLYYEPDLSPVRALVSSSTAFHWLMIEYLGILAVSLLSIIAGLRIGARVRVPKRLRGTFQAPKGHHIRRFAYFLLILALLLSVLKLNAVGGFTQLFESMHMRAALLAGTGAYDIGLIPAANLAVLLLIYARTLDKTPSILTIIIITALLAGTLALFGGRKAPMFLIVFAVLTATAYHSRLRLSSPVFVFGYLSLGVIFWGLYYIRMAAAIDAQIDVSTSFTLADISANLSYLDTYLFIIHHFDAHDYWYGQTFPEIILRFVPGYYSFGRPPLDDGVYVRSLFHGMTTEPGMAFEDLYQSSLPPETIGFGFMNFGLIGVILFSLAKGFITGMSFKVARARHYEPLSLYFAIFVAMNFHITNLRIFQTLSVLAGVILFAYAQSFVMRSNRIARGSH